MNISVPTVTYIPYLIPDLFTAIFVPTVIYIPYLIPNLTLFIMKYQFKAQGMQSHLVKSEVITNFCLYKNAWLKDQIAKLIILFWPMSKSPTPANQISSRKKKERLGCLAAHNSHSTRAD